MTQAAYLALITTQHADKPLYMASVAASLAPICRVQELLADMSRAFDLDEAVGAQLDAVGLWAGITRNIRVPIEGVYFEWGDEGTITSITDVGGKALFHQTAHGITDGKLITILSYKTVKYTEVSLYWGGAALFHAVGHGFIGGEEVSNTADTGTAYNGASFRVYRIDNDSYCLTTTIEGVDAPVAFDADETGGGTTVIGDPVPQTLRVCTDNSILAGAGIDAFGLYPESITGTPEATDLVIFLSDIATTWFGTNTGWGMGSWKADDDPEYGIVSLDDENFRTLIKTKIAANEWDGTIPSAYTIWESLFGTDTNIIISDNQDMTITVAVTGVSLTPVFQAILTGGYVPLKPAGVAANYLNTTVLFEFDATDDTIRGWDSGSWG